MNKKKYEISKNVTYVNGQKIKQNVSTIELTEREALYDLSVGRISEKQSKKNSQQSKQIFAEDKDVEQSE